MERYLTEDLGVPGNGIQPLLGYKEHTSPDDPMFPSHAHIVGALLSLVTNPKISTATSLSSTMLDTAHATH